ncbi:MAG: hypothetical protein ABSA79_02620 [Candidatus Bathyarchaeia archaeon]|jgi:hypothetical protein
MIAFYPNGGSSQIIRGKTASETNESILFILDQIWTNIGPKSGQGLYWSSWTNFGPINVLKLDQFWTKNILGNNKIPLHWIADDLW